VRQIFLASAPGTPQRREAIERLRALRSDIEGGASFEELARDVSQAPGAQEGGIIGWVARGDLVAALEDAVFALQPGEVSGVVESANGAHLLKVDERQEAGSATFEDVRTDIEPVIRARKRDAVFGQWMDDLRERSRVRVFLR
jgi:parvulin-like peptidyl-prolyl isomerase